MKLRELDWSDYVEGHIAEHQVTLDEVEQVVFENPNHIRKGRGKGVFSIYGQTDAGRYLIVFIKMKDGKTAFVLTARDMDQVEQKLFKEQRR